ncbi:hypothetical protein [Nocardia vaccinii]|uniref:hypothetical protein n=1 Tax=Nocardia vaccinii TaxID=1822 RepID=UPI00082DF259|nr:hypothetical protein [Nocardia vaccinii]
MAGRRWSDLSTRSRILIVTAGVFDGVVRIAALRDLAHRPVAEVRGSKRVWATAIVLVNSVGVVPLAYFLLGRRAPDSPTRSL